MAKIKLKKNEPRTINARAWYYVNAHSVDVVASEGVTTATIRLTRRRLTRMLSELRRLK